MINDDPPMRTLGDFVFEVRDRIALIKDRQLPYVGLEHLASGGFRLLGTAAVETSVSANGLFREGDILFGKLRPNLRKIVQVDFPGYCSTDLLILRASRETDARFSAHLLNWVAVSREAVRTTEGTKMPRTSWRKLRNFRVAGFSVAEQRRIAEILDAVDKQIAAGQRQLEKSMQIKSAAFGGLMSAREGTWPTVPMANVTSDVPGSSTIGPFGSDLIANDYRTSGVPVIFVRDIKASGLDWRSGVFVPQEKARELKAHSVQPGDLVVTKMGLPPCIAAEYPSRMAPGIITADVIRVRPETRVTTAKWLALTINHPAFEAQVREIAAGVTRSKVTLADFRRLTVKVPSLAEQQTIIDLSDLASEEIEIQRKQLAKLRTLKQALMDDLLTGRVRVPVGGGV